MDERLTIINKLLNDLEKNIGILTEALKVKEVVSLVNNDIFKSIVTDIKKLEKYNIKGSKDLFAYYRVALSRLNIIFCNRENIKKEEMNNIFECLNDIRILKNKLNISLPYNAFFEDLKSIYRSLKTINIDGELTYNSISSDTLKFYENIIIKYRNLVAKINEIKPDMNNSNFNSLKLDLDTNYSGFKANLNELYMEILKSNNDIAEPLMDKLKHDFDNENYESILKTRMVNKEITDYKRRNELSKNLDMLIESLNVIINRYEFSKVDKSNTNIDIDYIDNNTQDDYDIEIPQFIENNYEEHKMNRNDKLKSTEYDKKISAFIARFENLKRKLSRKNNLTKEEVKIYNKLESELDVLKRKRSNRFISSIKFNHYYKALNKKMKLSRKNKFKQVSNSNKKRK